MKKTLPIIIATFLLTPTVIFAGQTKVTVCHLPPGNPENGHAISIPLAQWEGAGGHSEGAHGGDYLGECQDSDTAPTPTETQEPEVTPTPTGSLEPTPTDEPEVTPTPTTEPGVTETPTPTGTIEPTPTDEPEVTPTPTETQEPTPTEVVQLTVEEETQSTIDQIIALIEDLVDFIQNQ